MNQTATTRRESAKARTPHSEAAGTAVTPRLAEDQESDQSARRGSRLPAFLRWLRRKVSGLARWLAKRLRVPLGPIARSLILHWVAQHMPAPLRWLGRLLDPATERGFGYWWLVATLAIAGAIGIVVALLVLPVAALIALIVVAVWALVRRSRADHRDDRTRRAPARRPQQRLRTPGRAAAEAPASTAWA